MAWLSDIPPELLDEMTPAVRAFVDALLLRLKELESDVADLEAKLAKNSRNSSKPPSTEHPHAKPPPEKKPKSKRKPGRQRGHQKFDRTLIPTDQCKDIDPGKPSECRGCGKSLRGSDPDRLSFTNTLKILRYRLPECPRSQRGRRRRHRDLIDEISEEIIEPRRNRINPRAIKKTMSKWKKKQPEDRHCPQPHKKLREALVMLD